MTSIFLYNIDQYLKDIEHEKEITWNFHEYDLEKYIQKAAKLKKPKIAGIRAFLIFHPLVRVYNDDNNREIYIHPVKIVKKTGDEDTLSSVKLVTEQGFDYLSDYEIKQIFKSCSGLYSIKVDDYINYGQEMFDFEDQYKIMIRFGIMSKKMSSTVHSLIEKL